MRTAPSHRRVDPAPSSRRPRPPARAAASPPRTPYLSWAWLGLALAGPAIGVFFPQLVAADIIGRRAAVFRLWCLGAGVAAGAWALGVAWLTLHRANRQLAALASQDPLTGLANLRRFHTQLTAVLAQAGPSCLVVGDLDYFKRINDQYGHLVGDSVLVSVATTLAYSVRAQDVVARIGGEEFGLLLPGADLAVATAMAERLRRAIESLPCGVTISLGIAVYPDDAMNPTALVKAADDAAYRAKRLGRNQVAVWQAEPPSGSPI